MAIPRVGDQRFQPLLDALEGKKNRPLSLGSPTGLFGATGTTRLGTGALGTTAGTTGSAGGTLADLRSNGGTGTSFYTLQDVVHVLKRHGLIL